jgi:hypothetical protein
VFRIASLPWYTCGAGSCSLRRPTQTTRNEWWLRSLLVIIWIAEVRITTCDEETAGIPVAERYRSVLALSCDLD